MRTQRVIAMALATLAVFAGAVADQPAPGAPPPPPPGGGPHPMGPPPAPHVEWIDQDIRDLVTTIMIARVSRELELNDEQTVLLVRHVEEAQEVIGDLSDQRDEIMRELRDKVKGNAADEEVQAVLDRLVEIDRKRVEAREQAYEKASSGLSVTQKAKLYIFMQDFENHMKRLIQKAREISGDRLMRWREEGGDRGPGGYSGRGPGDGERPMLRDRVRQWREGEEQRPSRDEEPKPSVEEKEAP